MKDYYIVYTQDGCSYCDRAIGKLREQKQPFTKNIMKRYDIKSANDLVFIPCHLNTPNKIKTTKKLIEHYSEKYFVLLGSHIAIPEEVSALADFVFVDKNNPITGVDDKYFTNSRIFCWIHVFDKCLSKDVPYHGYAHMLLLRNAYYLSLGWNFKKFHHVNYDIPLNFCDNNKISHHSELLNEFDFIAYKWYNNHNKLDTNLFSFTTEHQYEKFIDMKTDVLPGPWMTYVNVHEPIGGCQKVSFGGIDY